MLNISRFRHIMIAAIIMSLCAVWPARSYSKARPPIMLSTEVSEISGGAVSVNVLAKSMIKGEFELSCNYGKLVLLEGEPQKVIRIDANGSEKFHYRFELPEQDEHYEIWFTLKSTGKGRLAVKSLVEINKLVDKPKGMVKRIDGNRGVRELGP